MTRRRAVAGTVVIICVLGMNNRAIAEALRALGFPLSAEYRGDRVPVERAAEAPE